MSIPTIGSLCSGYGGLDLAIERFFGAETAWFSEYESAPSKVLEAHWPGVPNLGDMTKIDWSAVEPVDIIAGGTPCQDLSAAGKRKGMTEGTRSNLWVQMREAVAVIRPSIVIWENVRGAFSAYATSEVESEPGLLGTYGLDRPALRALGRVLGDLSDLGYDTEWVGVRASDAGAPHGRFRVFVVAYTESGARSIGNGNDVRVRCGTDGRESTARPGALADTESVVGYGTGRAWHGWTESANGSVADTASGGRDGRAQDTLRETLGRNAVAGSRGDAAADADEFGCERSGRGSQTGPSAIAQRATADADRSGLGSVGRVETVECDVDGRGGTDIAWGDYEPAIRRWERALGRVAPSPTDPTGTGGAQRLSPAFVEWMMGLDAGWVTGPAIGLSRTEQLKALGNGVVPQQAELALSILWPRVLESLGVAA